MWFSRAAFIQEKPDVVERVTPCARQGDEADEGRHRDAFFAQMAAKAFGARTDPKLAELQWNNMRAYFAPAMTITGDGMAGARKFFHIPAGLMR